jgi:hypothetical protein
LRLPVQTAEAERFISVSSMNDGWGRASYGVNFKNREVSP